MNDIVVIVAIVVVLTSIAFAWRAWMRHPRLRVELNLRGTTRRGTLDALIHNDGHARVADVTVKVSWAGKYPVGQIVVDEVLGRDATLVQIADLHRGVPKDAALDRIVVEATARGARAGRASLVVVEKQRVVEPAAPAVQYLRQDALCAASPDGEHWIETQRVPNDGVMESWESCRRCRYVKRLPLSAEEQEVQRAARRARDAAHARESNAPPPSRDDEGQMPLQIAFYVLGLEPSATWRDVEAAFRRLAKESHPDTAGSADPRVRALLEEKMRDVNRARDRLRDHFARGP